MKPLHTAVRAASIVKATTVAAFAIALASALPASAVAGGAGAATRTMCAPARAAHTDASARHLARNRAAHARHRHHRLAHVTRGGVTTTRPQPLSPPRSRPEHRAALPRVSARVRTPSGPRDGHGALALAPVPRAQTTPTGARLDPDRFQLVVHQGGGVHAGRGPPRAGPLTTLPPFSVGGLPSFLTSATLPTQLQSSRSSASHVREVCRSASARPGAAFPYRDTPSSEPLTSCSYANRPEGAVACGSMPSAGGLT